MRMPPTAKAKASQPYLVTFCAFVHSGAAAIRSLAASQMQRYGAMLKSMETADSASPRKVRPLRLPAYSNRTATSLFFSFFIRVTSLKYFS